MTILWSVFKVNLHGCIFSKLLASVPTRPDSFGIQTVYIRIYRLFRTGDQISHIYEGVNAYKIIFQHIVGRLLTFLGKNAWMFDIFVIELAVLHLKKKNLGPRRAICQISTFFGWHLCQFISLLVVLMLLLAALITFISQRLLSKAHSSLLYNNSFILGQWVCHRCNNICVLISRYEKAS